MNQSPLSHRKAFSLIELVVVIAIIAIIATFTVPAATSIVRGSAMTQAQQMLTDQFRLARQSALSKGRPVELRLYSYADPEQPGENVSDVATFQFRGMQIFETLENGMALPLDKPQRLPATVVMNKSTQLSTILASQGTAKTPNATKDVLLPRGVASNYRYLTVRFQPDGSTTLPTGTSNAPSNWFVTIHNLSDLNQATGASPTAPPPNFFTLQVDPVSGAIKGFRPTAG